MNPNPTPQQNETHSNSSNFAFIQKFESFFFSKKIKKKEFIFKAGEVCDHMIFLKKGLIRVYLENERKEINTWFVQEDEFFISINSYYYNLPSPENIQALEDCEVILIKKNIYHLLLKKNHQLAVFAINQMYLNLCEYQDQCLSLRFMSAEKKYEFLKLKKPDILNRLSQKHIASFLGVETTYLSKIITHFKTEKEEHPD